MSQSIFIQVGQCGNQIGRKFWEAALREQQKYSGNEEGSFFRAVNETDRKRSDNCVKVKARAILIDMEEGVIMETLRGQLREIFDSKQLVTDVSGSGNNWAVGHHFYGKLYENKIKELVRREVNMCDNLQCFFLLHSMGGGTGSGLGTAILDLLHDEYPKKQKFVFAVYPSSCDDVVTSPYNAVLANDRLVENADCIFPIENEALVDMANYTETSLNSGTNEKSFNRMNSFVANMILDTTAPSRFPGILNIDLNEIVTNMVPYPRLHYITSSMTPLSKEKHNLLHSQRMNQIFTDLFSPHHRFSVGEIRQSIYLACAVIFRGQVHFSDVQRTVDKMQSRLRFVPWNKDGFKIGICSIPPLHSSFSAVMLSNSSTITHSLSRLRNHFHKMYKKKAHLHHFLQVDEMLQESFDSSLHNLDSLIDEYSTLRYTGHEDKPRLRVLV